MAEQDAWLAANDALLATGARAIVAWRVEDVQSVSPQLSEEEALVWLETHESNIADRMTERGWDAIYDLLHTDGIPTPGEPNANLADQVVERIALILPMDLRVAGIAMRALSDAFPGCRVRDAGHSGHYVADGANQDLSSHACMEVVIEPENVPAEDDSI